MCFVKIDVEYGDALYHTEVWWLSCGTDLKCFLALRIEIEKPVDEKGKVVAELGDEKWLWNLALLCEISHHLHD